MYHRSLFLLIMVMLVNSVISKEDSSIREVRKEKSLESRMRFKNSPSAEDSVPIPVAVIYENAESHAKSEIITEADIDEEDNVTEENILTTTYLEETTATVITVDHKTELPLVQKPRALNNFQIPVSVVNDNDRTNYQNYRKSKTETNRESLKRLPSRRRSQQTKTSVDIKNEQIPILPTKNLEIKQKNAEPIAGTRTFKKRTEGRDPVVPIIESENYVFSHSGNFHYRYEGGDGTRAFSEGKLKTVDEQTGEAVVGGFSYTDKDGNDFSLSYTADENGYRPVGDHLPTPPPIPPAIARALKYLATATPEPVTKRTVKL